MEVQSLLHLKYESVGHTETFIKFPSAIIKSLRKFWALSAVVIQ